MDERAGSYTRGQLVSECDVIAAIPRQRIIWRVRQMPVMVSVPTSL